MHSTTQFSPGDLYETVAGTKCEAQRQHDQLVQAQDDTHFIQPPHHLPSRLENGQKAVQHAPTQSLFGVVIMDKLDMLEPPGAQAQVVQ